MTKTSDIFLIVPPSRTNTQWLPFGLMHISSYLSAQGDDNVILDYKDISEAGAFNKILLRISTEKPRFVGITCMVSEIEMVKNLCLLIRKENTFSKIIIGGPHPSSNPQHFIDFNVSFDYLVIGEGEQTFHELIKVLRANKPVDSVKGIAYIKDGILKINDPRPLIENIDSLPFPAYDKVDMEYYCRPNVWTIRPIYISSFNLFTVRGCCYSCKFCVEYTVFGRKVRGMSPERVAEHIEYVINKYRIDAIYFMDELFTLSKERIYKIFNLLNAKSIHIIFGCQTRVNLLDSELAKFMKENGCLQIDFGIESGSEKMLKVMNKNTTIQRIVETGQICNKAGIRHLANMLINLPGETMEDIEMSVQLAKRMKYSLVLWNVYLPFPGSGLGKSLELMDFNTILQYPSKMTIDLLEKKYKFGNYSKSLHEILDYLHRNTFHPKYLKLTLNLDYWKSMFYVMSFLFDKYYLHALFKSRRKVEYFTNLFKQTTKM
ncbi:MAG: radical SAM protein [Elusimicrobia bacterium]|nr:radical SAM protein [Elusimicrobiota bacterium]